MVKRIKLLEKSLKNTERYVLGELDRNNEDSTKQKLVEGYFIYMKNIKTVARDVMTQKGYSHTSLENFFKEMDQSINEVVQRTPEYILINLEDQLKEYRAS